MSPDEDVEVFSSREENTVVLELMNVRSMTLDGEALANLGVRSSRLPTNPLMWFRAPCPLAPWMERMRTYMVPSIRLFARPFCFIYSDDGTEDAKTAAYLSSYWALIGNGQACGLTEAQLGDSAALTHNRIYLELNR